ncbi:response regulator transcription factor [Verticiella sediminum]|uniref:Response regulator transcription factor n=1 Tax=Verticiella sediminum TaxID=1247510 RepID=A0A556ALS3_9BURK|nr:response regulator [Verticiella sediminum]TSH93832.1 response regulator transcription factor [Verticiella sediminum]
MSSTASPAKDVSPHVLIADDRPDDLRLLIELLRAARVRISVALDGAQAYARALALVPDLILLDVHMPRMDGYTVCRRLAAEPTTAHIPIIFLSAAGEVDERLEGLHSGGVDYVVKPFSAQEVLARIGVHLGRAALPPRAAGIPSTIGVSSGRTSTGSERRERDQALVAAATRYLSDHLAQPPRMQELAHRLGTNEKRLTRAFKTHLGKGGYEFLREQRLAVARRLLRETDLSIADIAGEIGFSSAANFATAFREHSGSTPSAYREAAATEAPHAPAAPLEESP